MTAPITPDPVALGRQRLDASRLGTLAARETDRDLLAIRDLVAEVERLRASTSPAWDEDTVRAKVADILRMFLYAGSGDPDHEIDTTAADVLAVVRRHLPVSGESRATVQAEALRDAADAAVAQDNTQGDWWDDDQQTYGTPVEWLRARADRLKKEDDRG